MTNSDFFLKKWYIVVHGGSFMESSAQVGPGIEHHTRFFAQWGIFFLSLCPSSLLCLSNKILKSGYIKIKKQ